MSEYIPYHTHDGVNSPIISSLSSFVVYAGQVASNGSIVSLPTGWSVSHPSTGSYTITHNLGLTKTSFLFLSQSSVSTGGSSPFPVTSYMQYSTGQNTFSVSSNNSGSASDNGFQFMLVTQG